MNTLNQAAIAVESMKLQAIESAEHIQDHIQELASKVVDSDLTLQYGSYEEINVTTVAEKLLDMSAEGRFKFLPEDIASAVLAASATPDDTSKGIMPLRDSMYKAAVELITAHYDAILKTIDDQAAADAA